MLPENKLSFIFSEIKKKICVGGYVLESMQMLSYPNARIPYHNSITLIDMNSD